MLIFKKLLYFIVTSFFLTSCGLGILSGGGTHGMIQGYLYPISKNRLDSTIQILISSNDKIVSEKGDGTIYSTVVINDVTQYKYVYRYYGDENYLKEHPNESKIFLTAIKIGNEEYKIDDELNSKERKEAILVFKKYFILKLDSMLNDKASIFE